MYLVCHIFTVVMFSRSKMEKALLEQENLDFFKVCRHLFVACHYAVKCSHIFRKPACLVEIEFRETIAPMSNAGTVQGTAFPPTQVPTSRLTLFTVRTSQYK